MDSNISLRTCKTCGYPYQVDESTESHMNPPDDYRRGFKRYCLACWLGVGPKDAPDLFCGGAQPVPRKEPKADRVSGTKIRFGQPKSSRAGVESFADGMKSQPSVYLWLCCEGWVKFGPFEWLRFDDERQAILGPDGEEVAKKLGGRWEVPGEKWQGGGFSDPTITSSPIHPHRDCGAHPG